MGKKLNNLLDFMDKDIQKEEDVLEISTYLEEADYPVEELRDLLQKILLRFIDNTEYSSIMKRKKRYLN
ncbi:MAG: hypothetical protein ABH857_00525 [Elusimicrobiota bacterium]